MARFSQNLVVYYWYFRVKDIHFVSLHTAQKVYKTVSCLLLSKSFPAQRYLHNVWQTIFGTFLSCCCAIFEQANDWLVVWCLISPVIMFSLMFRQHRHLLTQTQHSGVVIEHVSAWWVVWCLDWPETVFGSVFLLLLCSLRHTVCTPGPNNDLHFFCFSFERQ